MELEGQVLSLKKKKKTLSLWNVPVNAGISECFTDLPDLKVIFIIIIYNLSLIHIINWNIKSSPQPSHCRPPKIKLF